MTNKIIEGIYFGLGFFLVLSLISGLVWATGFHSANEILEGTFSGNFIFNDNVTFNGKTNGISLGGFTDTVGFTSPGNYTWTVPDGITKIKITAAGAGGGGGGSGGTYGVKAPSGSNTTITGLNIDILAIGGEGGYGRGASGGSDAANMSSAIGGDINLKGEGAEGGGAAITSYSQTGTEGRNGGLAIKTINVISGTSYNITIGKGGIGSTGAYGTGETGADGYVIIEY